MACRWSLRSFTGWRAQEWCRAPELSPRVARGTADRTITDPGNGTPQVSILGRSRRFQVMARNISSSWSAGSAWKVAPAPLTPTRWPICVDSGGLRRGWRDSNHRRRRPGFLDGTTDRVSCRGQNGAVVVVDPCLVGSRVGEPWPASCTVPRDSALEVRMLSSDSDQPSGRLFKRRHWLSLLGNSRVAARGAVPTGRQQ